MRKGGLMADTPSEPVERWTLWVCPACPSYERGGAAVRPDCDEHGPMELIEVVPLSALKEAEAARDELWTYLDAREMEADREAEARLAAEQEAERLRTAAQNLLNALAGYRMELPEGRRRRKLDKAADEMLAALAASTPDLEKRLRDFKASGAGLNSPDPNPPDEQRCGGSGYLNLDAGDGPSLTTDRHAPCPGCADCQPASTPGHDKGGARMRDKHLRQRFLATALTAIPVAFVAQIIGQEVAEWIGYAIGVVWWCAAMIWTLQPHRPASGGQADE